MSSTATSPVLQRKPEARTETVEDLVDRFRRGLLRVPSFQRALKWQTKEVLDLYDSIYRGYPIGSLLLWQRPAQAEKLRIGPLTIDAPETATAWWVVDGQQRLTSLAIGLLRPEPVPQRPVDAYVVYFDPREQRFETPPHQGALDDAWVPVAHMLDAAYLSGWIVNWPYFADATLRSRVFEAGKRLREYRVPLYLVETDDEDLLREIFYRVNNTGKRLEWSEVHDALLGGRQGMVPSTLSELADELAKLGMGRLTDGQLLPYLMAVRGLDVTRNLADHRRRDRDVLSGAVGEALPVMRRLFTFLREHAEIPHLRLLPLAAPAVVLARFFRLHPEPSERTLILLQRFVWRALAATGSYDDRTLQRRGVADIVAHDEEKSAQELLVLLPSDAPAEFILPATFDARAASSRIALLALVSMQPRSLEDGSVIDVEALIEELAAKAFRYILHDARIPAGYRSSPANRMVYPVGGLRLRIRHRIQHHGFDDPVLLSHGIDAVAAEHLARERNLKFLDTRGHIIEHTARMLIQRLAAWSRSDRPSIDYLLRQVADEASP